jgi:hypothetical protein
MMGGCQALTAKYLALSTKTVILISRVYVKQNGPNSTSCSRLAEHKGSSAPSISSPHIEQFAIVSFVLIYALKRDFNKSYIS